MIKISLTLIDFKHIPIDYPNMNGGLFYATDSINYQQCIIDAKSFIQKYAEYFHNSIDELAFAYTAYKNRLPLTSLDHRIYNVYPKLSTYQSKIIHFASFKPWDNEFRQLTFPQWLHYYYQCTEITNCTSEKVIDFGPSGQQLRKIENESTWLYFLNRTKLDIPSTLNLRFEFHTEKLYIDYYKGIYFEFTNHLYHNYSISFIIESWDIVFEQEIIHYFHDLIAQNKEFSFKVDKHKLIFSSKTRNIEQIPLLWKIFYRKCQPILEKY